MSGADAPAAPLSHIYLASNLWDDLWVIQQPIASVISRDEDVLYVERFVSLFMVFRYPSMWRRIFAWLRGARRVAPRLRVLAPLPLFHLGHRFPLLFALELRIQQRWIRWWAGAPVVPRVLWMDSPLPLPLAGHLDETALVYHVGDEVSAFDTSHEVIMRALERRMLERADVVFAAAEQLRRDKLPHNDNAFTVWNAIDPSAYAGSDDRPSAIDSLREPRAIFVGVVEEWVDIDALAAAARALPNVSFAIVGPVRVPVDALRALPNVTFVGRVGREEVARMLGRCAVSLIPFVRSRLTERLVPLKLFEALAAGVMPVATRFSSDLEPLEQQGLVAVANRADELATTVRDAIRDDSST
ncbi:MAG TPA: glycosyltransferase, partial [Gemmatimonadaceae bacterium]|nr:glycosyltransferase [Gemmatimonadaceae bacterium]